LKPDGKYSLHCVQEGQQCLAWKQLLTFEKGNPQRLDAVGLSKHVAFTYEQVFLSDKLLWPSVFGLLISTAIQSLSGE
jgi:hypothetical protein